MLRSVVGSEMCIRGGFKLFVRWILVPNSPNRTGFAVLSYFGPLVTPPQVMFPGIGDFNGLYQIVKRDMASFMFSGLVDGGSFAASSFTTPINNTRKCRRQ